MTRESPNSPNDVAQVLLDIKGGITHNNQSIILFQVAISLDFTPLFDWNTKQLFLYVVASYETDDHVSDENVTMETLD